jgi:hypothetical protein
MGMVSWVFLRDMGGGRISVPKVRLFQNNLTKRTFLFITGRMANNLKSQPVQQHAIFIIGKSSEVLNVLR